MRLPQVLALPPTDLKSDVGMPAHNTTPATTSAVMNQDSSFDAERNVFPFFRLPRELRDTIYEFVGPVTYTTKLECGLNLEADTKRNNIRAVSKQFRKEYEEVILKLEQHLELTDCFITTSYEDEWILPSAAQRSTHVHINLVSEAGSDSWGDWGLWRGCIPMVLCQLRSMRSLTIRLDMAPEEWEEDVERAESELRKRFWAVMPFQSFKVYKSNVIWSADKDSREIEDETLLLEFSGESRQLQKFYEF